MYLRVAIPELCIVLPYQITFVSCLAPKNVASPYLSMVSFYTNYYGGSIQSTLLPNFSVTRFDLGTGSITLVSRYSIQLGKPVSIRALRY